MKPLDALKAPLEWPEPGGVIRREARGLVSLSRLTSDDLLRTNYGTDVWLGLRTGKPTKGRWAL